MSETTQFPESRISLALQGGGAHGAFTWGVLDCLLAESGIAPGAISGTSAGAMNAVVCAHGWVTGGRNGARRALQEFWEQVSARSCFNPYRLRVDVAGLGPYWPLGLWTQWWGQFYSPYQSNPLDLNPLRDILIEQVDFRALREPDSPRLLLAATDVLSNRLQLFGNESISVDRVLASAALPDLYKAVEIDGRYYWDGGFLSNPPLEPLAALAPDNDLLLIQVNPERRQSAPDTPTEIADRKNEITFNAALVAELRRWSARLRRGDTLPPLHRIDAPTIFEPLGPDSKLDTSWSFLTRLRDAGRRRALQWLKENGDRIGRESSFDLRDRFLDNAA